MGYDECTSFKAGFVGDKVAVWAEEEGGDVVFDELLIAFKTGSPRPARAHSADPRRFLSTAKIGLGELVFANMDDRQSGHENPAGAVLVGKLDPYLFKQDKWKMSVAGKKMNYSRND